MLLSRGRDLFLSIIELRQSLAGNRRYASGRRRIIRYPEPAARSMIRPNTDPNEPIQAPFGRTGRPRTSRQSYIGGSQHYLPQALPLIAPYVNSYRRFLDEESSAPTCEGRYPLFQAVYGGTAY